MLLGAVTDTGVVDGTVGADGGVTVGTVADAGGVLELGAVGLVGLADAGQSFCAFFAPTLAAAAAASLWSAALNGA